MLINVQGSTNIDVIINENELSRALFQIVNEKLGDIDDAGCDWMTDSAGNTYIADQEWQVSSDPFIGTLVDACNALKYGRALKLELK